MRPFMRTLCYTVAPPGRYRAGSADDRSGILPFFPVQLLMNYANPPVLAN